MWVRVFGYMEDKKQIPYAGETYTRITSKAIITKHHMTQDNPVKIENLRHFLWQTRYLCACPSDCECTLKNPIIYCFRPTTSNKRLIFVHQDDNDKVEAYLNNPHYADPLFRVAEILKNQLDIILDIQQIRENSARHAQENDMEPEKKKVRVDD